MRLTHDDYMACDAFCFAQSWTLRRCPDAGRRLVRRTLDLVALSGSTDGLWLTERLSADVRKRRPGSLVLVFMLLRFLLPIVIRLVVEWWKRRQEGQ